MMRLAAILIAAAGTAQAEVSLACIAPDLPAIVITYPDGVGAAPQLSVGTRPAVEMSAGQGRFRVESARVDGYLFAFTPAQMEVAITNPASDTITRALSCARIGGPVEESPLDLSALFPAADASDPPEAAPAKDSPAESVWHRSIETSRFDDSQTVTLSSDATETAPGPYGGRFRPLLVIRCLEDTTSIYIHMGDHHMADIQGYGQVDLRIDAGAAFTASMSASDSGSALGHWRGGQAIPLVQKLIGAQELVARVTPYSHNPIEMSFALTGLEHDIAPLRAACHW